MHKVLNILQSGDYLSLTKAQKLQFYKTAFVTSKALYCKKVIKSEYNFLIKNQTWELTDFSPDRKVITDR